VAAPPKDLSGNTAVTALGVGAHRVHLAGGDVSRAVACTECHAVPAKEDDPGHRDSALPAEVQLTGVATSENRVPVWNRQKRSCANAWCHSPTAPGPSPEWTSDAGRLPCNGCHGTPPAPPHPQMTDCSRCHGAVVGDDDKSIKDKSRHVDGKIDVVVPEPCTSCHGGTNNAPPTDTTGSSSTSSPGVGAHQAHVVGKGSARKVACSECHVVPGKWSDPGHLDSASPAELTFSGVATTGGAAPVYSGGSCQKTYCHGASFPKGNSGGALTEPVWTKVDGSQISCGNCHSLPPAPPHLNFAGCSGCHKNIDASLKFLFPDTHIDGVVTFSVP
jgi:predicted CxxxxCH...CXXCH cytochrome family protein